MSTGDIPSKTPQVLMGSIGHQLKLFANEFDFVDQSKLAEDDDTLFAQFGQLYNRLNDIYLWKRIDSSLEPIKATSKNPFSSAEHQLLSNHYDATKKSTISLEEAEMLQYKYIESCGLKYWRKRTGYQLKYASIAKNKKIAHEKNGKNLTSSMSATNKNNNTNALTSIHQKQLNLVETITNTNNNNNTIATASNPLLSFTSTSDFTHLRNSNRNNSNNMNGNSNNNNERNGLTLIIKSIKFIVDTLNMNELNELKSENYTFIRNYYQILRSFICNTTLKGTDTPLKRGETAMLYASGVGYLMTHNTFSSESREYIRTLTIDHFAKNTPLLIDIILDSTNDIIFENKLINWVKRVFNEWIYKLSLQFKNGIEDVQLLFDTILRNVIQFLYSNNEKILNKVQLIPTYIKYFVDCGKDEQKTETNDVQWKPLELVLQLFGFFYHTISDSDLVKIINGNYECIKHYRQLLKVFITNTLMKKNDTPENRNEIFNALKNDLVLLFNQSTSRHATIFQNVTRNYWSKENGSHLLSAIIDYEDFNHFSGCILLIVSFWIDELYESIECDLEPVQQTFTDIFLFLTENIDNNNNNRNNNNKNNNNSTGNTSVCVKYFVECLQQYCDGQVGKQKPVIDDTSSPYAPYVPTPPYLSNEYAKQPAALYNTGQPKLELVPSDITIISHIVTSEQILYDVWYGGTIQQRRNNVDARELHPKLVEDYWERSDSNTNDNYNISR